MGLVGRFRPGKHNRVVRGIDPVTPAWSDGDAVYPVDDRLVDPAEAPKKNEHFRAMLVAANSRGLTPGYVGFDFRYSGKENFKAVRADGRRFLTRVRSNRRVNFDRTENKSIGDQPIAATVYRRPRRRIRPGESVPDRRPERRLEALDHEQPGRGHKK